VIPPLDWNERLDIELRNRSSPDVERLLALIDALEEKAEELMDDYGRERIAALDAEVVRSVHGWRDDGNPWPFAAAVTRRFGGAP
jgi:hypothetical protein